MSIVGPLFDGPVDGWIPPRPLPPLSLPRLDGPPRAAGLYLARDVDLGNWMLVRFFAPDRHSKAVSYLQDGTFLCSRARIEDFRDWAGPLPEEPMKGGQS